MGNKSIASPSVLLVATAQATDLIYLGRTRDAFGNLLATAQDCKIQVQNLGTGGNSVTTNVVNCYHNNTTPINLVSNSALAKFKAAKLFLYMQRNGKSQTEEIIIACTNGNSELNEGSALFIPSNISDIGIILSVSNDSNGLWLNIAVDNSNGMDVSLMYNILSIITL